MSAELNSDKPISREEEDQLNRQRLADCIADKINTLNDDYENSIIIGIEGALNLDKASFIKLVLNRVRPNTKNLVIEFKPWNFSARNYLIYELFILIAEKLDQIGYGIWWERLTEKIIGVVNKVNNRRAKCCKPLLRQLPRRRNAVKKIKSREWEYSGKERDISIGPPWVNVKHRSIQELLEITRIESLEKKRDEIHKLLKEREKRTIIVVECIDQLDREQTKNIFDLVRFAANSPNTIFVLTYDRNELCKRMNNESGVNFEVQLKEMVKCTYSLPKRAPQDTHNVSRAIIDGLNFGDFDEKQSK